MRIDKDFVRMCKSDMGLGKLYFVHLMHINFINSVHIDNQFWQICAQLCIILIPNILTTIYICNNTNKIRSKTEKDLR